METGQAILRIGDYEFELEQGFSDGYTNNMVPVVMQGYSCLTHPPKFNWMGGEFKPLNIMLNLVVGIQSALPTANALNAILTYFYQKALSPQPAGNVKPALVTVGVGSWFERNGYIQDLDVQFQDPWDIDTGMPMRATVKFIFLSDFLADSPNYDFNYLPSSSNWHFKYKGGSSSSSSYGGGLGVTRPSGSNWLMQ
jgi:hypothetical protein